MKPKAMLLLLFTGAVFFAKANNTGTGDESASKTDILGGVYSRESKKPLGRVAVTVYSAAKKEKMIMTDKEGAYAFDDLKAGTYKFVFEKAGYKKVTREKVIVRPDEGVQLNVEMAEQASFEFLPGPFHFSHFD